MIVKGANNTGTDNWTGTSTISFVFSIAGFVATCIMSIWFACSNDERYD
jgi:hypothetical protein